MLFSSTGREGRREGEWDGSGGGEHTRTQTHKGKKKASEDKCELLWVIQTGGAIKDEKIQKNTKKSGAQLVLLIKHEMEGEGKKKDQKRKPIGPTFSVL